jgi:hypothetical protein
VERERVKLQAGEKKLLADIKTLAKQNKHVWHGTFMKTLERSKNPHEGSGEDATSGRHVLHYGKSIEGDGTSDGHDKGHGGG